MFIFLTLDLTTNPNILQNLFISGCTVESDINYILLHTVWLKLNLNILYLRCEITVIQF